jgi:phytol kinase
MNYTAEALVSLGVAAAYALLFTGVEWLCRRRRIDPELSRKAVHFVAGLIALPFPWIFQSIWTVWLLGLPFVALLIYARRTGLLPSVTGVDRLTVGEVVFPLSICLVLLLSSLTGEKSFFVIAMLSLAVGDGLAGGVGKRWGLHTFRISGGMKSIEGSFAMFGATFLITMVVLCTVAGWSPARGAASGLLVAAVVTIVEATIASGLDNLAVPIVCWLILALVANRPWQQIAIDLAILAAISAIVLGLLVRRRLLGAQTGLALTLATFAGWMAGRWPWG